MGRIILGLVENAFLAFLNLSFYLCCFGEEHVAPIVYCLGYFLLISSITRFLIFQILLDFNSKGLLLLRTWSKCAFGQAATSIKFFHSRKCLIGGFSPLEIFSFPLSIVLSEQFSLNDLHTRPNANSF